MKKPNILLFCWIVDLVGLSVSFNINIDHPIIYLDQSKYLRVNSSQSSYFGFSVILHPGDNINLPWVQIGAPRSASPTVKYQNPGIVFRCNISSPCKYIEVDKEFGAVNTRDGTYNNKLDGAWIGGVMDISWRSNRSVVCAPRWINFYKGFTRNDYRMLGACYWSHLDSFKYHKKLPLFNTVYDIYEIPNSKQSVYDWGQGESGFAIHMPESGHELLIGAPGVFNWKGTSIIYKDRLFNDGPEPSRITAAESELRMNDAEIFSDLNVANSRQTTQTLSFGLFGYSVTSGYFYSKNLYYAGGAPRSKDYLGQVLICDFGKNHNQLLNVKDTKQGTQFGEYFGASLAAGDINQDGLDDLFVGAPFHKVSKYNEGRMYLFLGSRSGSLQEPPQGKFVDGKQVNAQFGSTITFLGNMNRDGFRYVAVSAPYEESTGVVYIFKGLPYGLDIVPVQRIVGSSFLPNIRGFGISISKPTDIDANGYKDIAIGAYKSGHVVILRTQPLVQVNTYFRETPRAILNDAKEFYVILCHEFQSYRGNPVIQIRRRIIVDEQFNRASLKSDTREMDQFNVNNNEPKCETVNITLRADWPNDYDPLTIKVTHEFVENKNPVGRLLVGDKVDGEDHFCHDCGVYDSARSTRTVTKSVPFFLGCGDENICVSELEFDCSFNGTGVRNDTFILGAANEIVLETKVHNKGDKAYLLRVQVDLPEEITLKQLLTGCEQNKTKIVCQVENPLDTNETKWSFLRLDMDLLNKRLVENFVLINVTVLTTSANKNLASKVIRLNLRTEADMSISGKSGEQSYLYGSEETKNVTFEQIFQIGKFGLSPVPLIYFEIFVPLAIKSKSGKTTFMSLYPPEGSLEGGQSIIFYNSNLTYLVDHSIQSSEGVVTDKMQKTRKRRSVPLSKKSKKREANFQALSEKPQELMTDSELFGNKTFEINCNSTDIICGKIYGNAGPFDVSKKSAVIQLRMILDTTALRGIIKKNDVIRYSSYATVKIIDPPNLVQSGKRPDMVVVTSLFVTESKIEIWIIIVAAISGLLLLLLLTLGLIKAGFFKRTKKEELEQLKAQSGMDNAIDTKNDPSDKLT